jgi:hypothetical protein
MNKQRPSNISMLNQFMILRPAYLKVFKGRLHTKEEERQSQNESS